MTHPFRQTEEEKLLNNDVTQFMLRESSYAFPVRQRHLIEIILFKTLASSPQALAATLRTMKRRLVLLRDGMLQDGEELVDQLVEDDDLDLEGLLDQIESVDEPLTATEGPIDGRALAAELVQVDSLIQRAECIVADSKSAALLSGLKQAFGTLAELGAARKALVFTESRRTQEFLAAYLENNGYAGKVVTFNGSNNHPTAKQAYERYVSKHAGSDHLTGSKAIDIRSALIEEFKDRGEILLATEAAAEGVNLQFCSLVVNYDLPWNPQRIEQRIGRCHRYGQKYDVVVLNFLSQDNLADRRVQDLLQQKFSLFEGLFGSSDEVLGAIEEGIDFESRVRAILKTCRTDTEIETAFDALQEELEDIISQKMTQAREQLLEHFDADVHERLKVSGESAQLALDKVGERFWNLTLWALQGLAQFDPARLGFRLPDSPSPEIPTGEYRLISTVRSDDAFAATEAHLLRLSIPLGCWLLDKAKSQSLPATSTVQFQATGSPRRISMLTPLIGKAGWLRLEKLTLDSDAREEFLLLTAITDAGDNLDQEITSRLFDVHGIEKAESEIPGPTSGRLAGDSKRLVHATVTRATENGNNRFRQVQTQINQWADDKITAAELEIDAIRRDLRAARRLAELAETLQAQEEAQVQITQLEAKRRRARRNIDDVEEKVEEERSKLLQQLRDRCQQQQTVETLFTIRFEVV